MEAKDNLHAGHRERMTTKFLSAPDSFSDHELLEVLLFFALPRVDTNLLAHKILNVFGSLEKVLSANESELTAIDGVGKKVATEIILVGRIFQRIKDRKVAKEPVYSFNTLSKQLIDYFHDVDKEKFLIICLDKSNKKILQEEVSDTTNFKVEVDVKRVAKIFAKVKPSLAIIAHNHPSGSASPSEMDDITTKKINLLCEVHGVNLIEHIIIAKDKAYSYFRDNRLDGLKRRADLSKILQQI